ncbi:MAG: aminotransferase class III-fold pyridoxal phosphate-dependent enzyme [Sedimentisphaerales bacterium]|nr:aminotransferase class III-fold pyridoxal phosphate-dependent enzyme [Sedimentisphaerales bacterium]
MEIVWGQINKKFNGSVELYKRARELFPYGTQLFSRRPELYALGQAPIYFERAKHGHFWDVDGNEFIDTCMGIGPVTLGYCYEPIDAAAKAQIDKGVIGTVNNELEIQVADLMVEMVLCAEMIKFCKSGGGADAIAVRIARGYTGKDVVLFCGYHGWHDWYISANLKSESTLNEHLMPGISTKGVPSALVRTCIPFQYNNLDSLRDTLKRFEGKVACIIMEATRFKHPDEGYLEGVRQLADEHKCVLIFDEVVTGFRQALGGAQQYYGVTPDLATFGKGIANGYPLAAVAGKKEIMASQYDNFISSTYYSDTVSLAAGLATLNELKTKPVIETMKRTGKKITAGLQELIEKHKIKAGINGHSNHFVMAFDYGEQTNKVSTLFTQEMVARGVYCSGMFYICYTHTQQDVEKILAAADETFGILSKGIEQEQIDELLKAPVRQLGFKRLV